MTDTKKFAYNSENNCKESKDNICKAFDNWRKKENPTIISCTWRQYVGKSVRMEIISDNPKDNGMVMYYNGYVLDVFYEKRLDENNRTD